MTAWLWIVAGAALAVVVPWLLPIVYGRAFSEAILPAICLIPAAAFAGQASILEESLRARGLAFVGVAGRIAGLAAMLAMALLLTPRWGTMGIVTACNAAQAAVLATMIWIFRDRVAETGAVPLFPRIADLLEVAIRSVRLVPIPAANTKAL
jgi:O-antigen/teichoic acid export membrane protein